MSKTTKPFDWEVYDDNNEFFDILTMTRNEAKEYQKTHPDYKLTELGYAEEDDYDKSNYYKHQVKITKRKRRFDD